MKVLPCSSLFKVLASGGTLNGSTQNPEKNEKTTSETTEEHREEESDFTCGPEAAGLI